MTPATLPHFGAAFPEIILALLALGVLLAGVFQKTPRAGKLMWAAVAGLGFVGWLVLAQNGAATVTFNGLFVEDAFARFAKLAILAGAATSLVLAIPYLAEQELDRFEFPVLCLLAVLGMMVMVSANDLLSLYLGLELQSLSLYVLAAFRRNHVKASEAGLKYFVLGALSSGMLLYGMSMVYGATGTTNLMTLQEVLTGTAGHSSLTLIFGLVFLAAGLAFKISAVPFHMWTPDVYEGSPTVVTSFFAMAPKVAAVCLLTRVFLGGFSAIPGDWRQIIVFLAGASMVLGAFAAMAQTNIKRLVAYSSIGHIGYALVGVAGGNADSVRGALVYMAIYMVMSAAMFAVILLMRRNNTSVEKISDLAGLSRTHPLLAVLMALNLFSMAGIPPLAGFFAKWFVFEAAIKSGLFGLAVLAVLSSVFGAFYYLRIIKIMYFDEAVAPLDKAMPLPVRLVLLASSLFIALFLPFSSPVVNAAEKAARGLFPEVAAHPVAVEHE